MLFLFIIDVIFYNVNLVVFYNIEITNLTFANKIEIYNK